MSKVTPIGQVPNTNLFWEKFEYEAWQYPDGKRVVVQGTDYLLVKYDYGRTPRRHVLANLDMGQLVALRASIDAIVAAASQEAE